MTSGAPASTASPSRAVTSRTRPAPGARSSLSIFMASAPPHPPPAAAPRPRCAQLVLHLHGLDPHEPRANRDLLTGGDQDSYDAAGHGRGEGGGPLGPGRRDAHATRGVGKLHRPRASAPGP